MRELLTFIGIVCIASLVTMCAHVELSAEEQFSRVVKEVQCVCEVVDIRKTQE